MLPPECCLPMNLFIDLNSSRFSSLDPSRSVSSAPKELVDQSSPTRHLWGDFSGRSQLGNRLTIHPRATQILPASTHSLHKTPATMDVHSILTSPHETNSQTRTTDETPQRDLKRKASSQAMPRESQSGRKPRACQECKRLKMKCELLPDRSRCTRCVRRGLECALKFGPRPLSPTAVEYSQKLDDMRQEIQGLKRNFDAVLRNLAQKPGAEETQQHTSPGGQSDSMSHAIIRNLVPKTGDETQQHTSPGGQSDSMASARGSREKRAMAMTRENSPELSGRGHQAQNSLLVTEPMGSLYEVTRLRNIRSNQAKVVRSRDEPDSELDDFITRGVCNLNGVQEPKLTSFFIRSSKSPKLKSSLLCAFMLRLNDFADDFSFQTSLNHYLWVGLEELHSSLASVRKSSQLLAATILTVTALHIPTSADTFDKCYDEFLSLVSSSMFSRYHSVDDVRALCIAAFWLSDGEYLPLEYAVQF
jgi:hypothetical protein